MKRALACVASVVLGVLTAVTSGAAPAMADTGGGCAQASNAYVCISVRSGTTNPLISDYYIDTQSRGEYFGDTFVNFKNTQTGANGIVSKGTWYPVRGHSPVYTQNKISGYNCARTQVVFSNAADVSIYSAFSPWQCW